VAESSVEVQQKIYLLRGRVLVLRHIVSHCKGMCDCCAIRCLVLLYFYTL
jgi:hypothetical protein